MGATNVMAAYQLYAGRVPPTSMQLLTYMALVSRDDDDKPWYGQGHEALAIHALGRDAPAREADIRAVERAVSPLFAVGAIEADRRAAPRRDGRRTVRYRLRLVPGMPQDIDGEPVDNLPNGHSGNGQRPTESDENVPRFVAERPTESGGTSDGNRGTEEPRGDTRSEREENHLDQESDSPPSTGTPRANHKEISNDEPTSEPTPPAAAAGCPGCGVLLDPDRTCRHRPCRHYGARLATVHPLAA